MTLRCCVDEFVYPKDSLAIPNEVDKGSLLFRTHGAEYDGRQCRRHASYGEGVFVDLQIVNTVQPGDFVNLRGGSTVFGTGVLAGGLLPGPV